MRINFETAEDVLKAFPTLKDDIAVRPDATEPLAFTRRLAASERPEDSLAFFAYLAPRREAVWWTCRCLAALRMGEGRGAAALAAARAWVKSPEEDERVAAIRAAEAGEDEDAETWAAYAAGWSGGNIAPDGPVPIAATANLTAKAVRAAVLVAVTSAPREERPARLERCLSEALAVAGEDIDAHFS